MVNAERNILLIEARGSLAMLQALYEAMMTYKIYNQPKLNRNLLHYFINFIHESGFKKVNYGNDT